MNHRGLKALKKSNWLDLAEYTSLIGLGVGSVATIVSSQFWFASAPLSLLVLLNLANRKRLETNLQQGTAIAVAGLDQKVSKHVELLHQQIQSLPTTEMLAGLKKSLLIKDREVLTQLSNEITTLKQQVQSQLDAFNQHEVADLKRNMDEVQSQFTELQEGVSQIQARLGHLSWAVRDGEAERAIAQLQDELTQVRTSLQKLTEQTRPTLTALQEQVTHLQRQMQKLPPPFDSSALRQEVTELVRVVSDLVPRRDWATVVQEVQLLQQQQESLAEANETIHRQLQDLNQQMQTRPSRANFITLQNQITHLNRQIQELPAPYDPTLLKQKLAALAKTVAERVPQQDFSGLVAQVKSLQQQQSTQAQAEVLLRREIQTLQEQLQWLMNETAGGVPVPQAATSRWDESLSSASWQDYLQTTLAVELEHLQQRLEMLPTDPEFRRQAEAGLQNILRSLNHQMQEQMQATAPGLEYEFIFDGIAAYDDDLGLVDGLRGGRTVLEEALLQTQQRLLLVLPWSSYYELDQTFLTHLEALLQRNCRIDLGWCHRDDHHTARFVQPINQRWQIQSAQQKRLQETLRHLLELKRRYPQLLQFKILGLQESFLVVDQSIAVVGITPSITGLAPFPEVKLKLRTTDSVVVQQLTDWFEHPVLAPSDEAAYWNRAITYYDLGDRPAALADLERLLSVNPEDALAYNLRGVVRYDLGDRQGAIADFTQALELNPRLVVTYCNRGYVHSETEDEQLDAIADFNAALRLHPNSAIAYFYRGTACQKFGEVSIAISNFDETIRLAPNAAPAYYYRGMAHTRMEEYEAAIADLERAVQLFEQEGSSTNAQKAKAQLERLRHIPTNQTSAA